MSEAGRRRLLVPLLVFSICLAVRAVYWASLEASPLSSWYLWGETDEHGFLDWSARIAAGNWLDVPAWRAWASWQAPFGSPEVWDRWYQHNVYYQGPLYTYFLALVRITAGFPVVPVRALQLLLLGPLAAAFLAAAAGTVLTRVAAPGRSVVAGSLAAGLLYGLYGPLVFHDGFLYRDGPNAHASTLLIALPLLLVAPPGAATMLLLGLFGGLTVLLKQTFLPVVLLVIAVAALRRDRSRERSKAAAWGLLGLTLPLSALVTRNVLAGAPPFAFDTRALVSLACANGRGADGTASPCPATGEILAAAGGSDSRVLVLVLRSWEENPSGLALLGLRKLVSFFHRDEFPDNASFTFFRDRLPSLRPLPVFACLLGPGLAGLVAARRRRLLGRGESAIAAAALVVPLISCLAVSTNSRYRAAVAGPLALGAGLGLGLLLARRRGEGVGRGTVVALGAAAALSLVPLAPRVIPSSDHRSVDALVAATLTEVFKSPEAGAAEIVRYVKEGGDDPGRRGGLVLAWRWWFGVREDVRIDPPGIALPEKRFRPVGPPPRP